MQPLEIESPNTRDDNNNNDDDASSSSASSSSSSSLTDAETTSLTTTTTKRNKKRSSRNKRHGKTKKSANKFIRIMLLVVVFGIIVLYVLPKQWISNEATPNTVQETEKSPVLVFYDKNYDNYKNKKGYTKTSRMIPGIIQSQYDQQEQMDEDGDCIAQYDWQLESYPTCNLLHEYDMTKFSLSKSRNANDFSILKLINHGYFRDVWRHKTPKPVTSNMQGYNNNNDDDELFDIVAIKTLRYEHEFLPIYYERNRRDAMASEHLTKYKSIMNIYGFCGQSSLFEYADGGTLEQTVWKSNEPLTSKEKLIIAYQVAQAFYAVHNVDKPGRASIAHTDAMAKQFLYVSREQRYKLNDFNSAEFITWNKYTNKPCPYEVTTRGGRYKAPEEYKDDYVTEKADMYSVGNIFYLLLTSAAPFYEELDDNIVIERIKNGESPGLHWVSDDFLVPLFRATVSCWDHDPKQRISSFQLQQHFITNFRIVGIPLSQDKVHYHEIPKEKKDVQYQDAGRQRQLLMRQSQQRHNLRHRRRLLGGKNKKK